MSNDCDLRDGILVDLSPDGLNSLTNASFDLIRKYIFSGAKRVNDSKAVTLYLSDRKAEHTITPSELVFEIDKFDFDKITGIDTTGYRGCYVKDQGKMYMNKNNWCIETMIHETLHACSRTSESDELEKYMPLLEGLTEFYTGYILFKEYSTCYKNCFQPEVGKLCQMTYEDTTKLWAAFCNFVPLQVSLGLYFNNGNSWEKAITNFVSDVQTLGFSKFKNPFSQGKLSIDLKFKIQCTNAFGSKFNEICENRAMYTDFSKVLTN